MKKRILAISGSLRTGSSNTAILLAAKQLAIADCEIVLFHGLDQLPHFNPDREGEVIPALTHFRDEIKKSHALIICSPEYAHGIPGTLKNALDWIVGTSDLDKLPVGIINATPLYEGKRFAQESLFEILKTMSANVTPETCLAISKVRSKIDSQGNLIDEETKKDLFALINKLTETEKI